MRKVHHDSIVSLIKRGLQSGMQQINAMRYRWDISGNCQNSYTTEFYGAPRHNDRKDIVIKKGSAIPYIVEIDTRCRKCESCLRARASRWRMRAYVEFKHCPRAWFGTLTLRPDRHHYYRVLTSSRMREQGIDLAALSEDEQFTEITKVIGEAITRYIKRLRKNSGQKLRYLLVTEAHASGLPHFHMIVYEVGGRVSHKVLSSAWDEGFEKWRLMPPDNPLAIRYVCKYISKDAKTRVRASIDFGNPKV